MKIRREQIDSFGETLARSFEDEMPAHLVKYNCWEVFKGWTP
jgi:hypothetical protein